MKLALKEFLSLINSRIDDAATAVIESEKGSEVEKAFLRGKLEVELEYRDLLIDLFNKFTLVRRYYKENK